MRIRSRVANLGDLKNPGLRQNVISGAITPAQIAVMTTEVCICILPNYRQSIEVTNGVSAIRTKQGRDDHIKQSSIQTPYISFFVIHVLWIKIPVGGYILDCLCDLPYLVS